MSNHTPEGPASGGPEFLDSGAGAPVGPSATERRGGGRKKAIIAGGVVGVLAVGGGAAWAIGSFMSTGDQPAQALPADTIAYASIDLDPSGGQKVEAITTLRKFPAFRDEVGLETDDDIKEKVFDEIVASGECEGLDYGKDVEPWLGDRMAVAAVDLGEEQPSPVFVVQVSDAGAAEDGVAKLAETCATEGEDGSEEPAGYAFDGDWMVLAETQDLAQKAVDAEGSLADDSDYQTWTDEAGDAGVAGFYIAPSAGQVLAELAQSEGGDMSDSELSTMTEALEQFKGAAGVVRFADGGMEMEFAADASAGNLKAIAASDEGGDVIASLPANTAAAFGLGLGEGWAGSLVDQLVKASGGTMTADDLYAEAEAQTGLTLPDDLETLLGSSMAISVSSDLDPEALANSADPTNVPVGIKIKGDSAEIEGVLDKIRPQLAGSGLEGFLETASDGDYVALSPSSSYRDEIVGQGELGDNEKFTSVVEEADGASAVLYVDFDAADSWLSSMGMDAQASENFTPLSAMGMSAWTDGDVSHSVVKVTTD